MAQPDFNLYPTFANATDAGTMSYYYRNGRVYINNSEHKPTLKRIVTDGLDLSRRATRIKARGQAGGSYQTSLGNPITGIAVEDELWVNHNYTGNTNWTSRGSAGVRNSWWYDVDQHREYKVYLVISYTTSQVIMGNTYADWRVKNAIVEYNNATYDNTAGTFKFTSVPDNPVTVRGRVHFNSSNVTWPTMSAKLYMGTDTNPDDTVLATQTIMRSAAVDESVSVEMDLDPAVISVNDIVSLAAEVDGTSGQINAIAAPLTVQDYSLEVVGGMGDYIAGGPVMLGGLGQSMDVADDCNPLLNNVGNYRGNRRVQIIEYSDTDIGSGSLTPANLNELRSSSAFPSSIPESYYTSLAFNRNRYLGSKFTRSEVNSTSIPADYQNFDKRDNRVNGGEGEDAFQTPDSLGEIEIVSLRDTHLGYFSRIIDPYPTLNGKTAYFVKYLMNDQNAVQDPSLSELGRINFTETFKIRDINNEVTQIQPVIQNREDAEELGELENNTEIFRVGEFPYPILYSQTSATTFSQNLPISGSTAFFTSEEVDIDTYRNYAFNTTDNTVANAFPIQGNLQDPINVPLTKLVPTTIAGTGLNNLSSDIFSSTGTTLSFPSTPLTDQYTIEGSFTFYTSALPYRRSYGVGSQRDNWAGTATLIPRRNGQVFTQGNYSLEIVGETNVTGTGSPTQHRHPSNPLGPSNSSQIRVRQSNGNNKSVVNPFRRMSSGFVMSLHSDIHEFGVANNGFTHSRYNTPNPADGNRIRFTINFSIPAQHVRSGDTFEWFFQNTGARRVGNINKDDPAGEQNPSYSRSIMPPVPSLSSAEAQARFSLRLRGTQTQNVQEDDINNVNFPYWEKPMGTTNQIRLISNQLNEFHGGDYYQGNLEYEHGVNAAFPLAQEPNFLEFAPVRNNWQIEVGDEFRFENDEEKVFVVTSVDTTGTQILVNFDREIDTSINLNFFLIRRYTSAPNIIILNQQKPYNVPPSASSSPGILLPEFRIDSLETDPDAIVTNLIERNLI